MDPIENGDVIPASYVSFPEGNAKKKKLTLKTRALNGFC